MVSVCLFSAETMPKPTGQQLLGGKLNACLQCFALVGCVSLVIIIIEIKVKVVKDAFRPKYFSLVFELFVHQG